MYPFARLALILNQAKRLPAMGILDTHVSHHRCWPQDCDIFMEMNNGRILTLYEFGRFQAAVRFGLWDVLKANNWGLTVAGSSIRYRRRITPFEAFEQRTRLVTWDERFYYIEQSMWKKTGECASHVLFRTAVVAKGRAIPSAELVKALGIDVPSPEAPAWIANWIAAEGTRPWPPMQDSAA
ncbi:MAG: acyl-CoA thioesterase [Shimia sp.]